MRYFNYLKEDIVSKALALGEPEVGKSYASEKVSRYLKTIGSALDAMKSKKESEANDSIVQDLRDKKKKWGNVDKETKPTKTKLEVPPEQDEEPPPEEEEPAPEPDPEKEKEKKKQQESNISRFFNA